MGHHESCATCARAVAEAQAPALMDWRAQAAARVCKPVDTWQSSQRQGPRKAFTFLRRQSTTGLRLLCVPSLTRGGARAVASPRSLRGHRNQMARSRHPHRSVRTRRRHSRRSCRFVCAPQPAPGSATHLHTYTLTSNAHTPCRNARHLGACAGARRGRSRRALRGARRRAIDGAHDGECVRRTLCCAHFFVGHPLPHARCPHSLRMCAHCRRTRAPGPASRPARPPSSPSALRPPRPR